MYGEEGGVAEGEGGVVGERVGRGGRGELGGGLGEGREDKDAVGREDGEV